MQISSKIALSISVVVAVAGAMATGIALDRQATERREEFRRSSVEALELLALSVAPAVAEGRHHRAQAVLDNIANFPERFPDVKALEVIDRSGRVVADLDPRRFNVRTESPALRRDMKLVEPAAREIGDDQLEVAVPLRVTHPLGVMRATLSEGRLAASISRQQRSAALLVLATMALIGLALHLVHRRLVGGRLTHLATTASTLGHGNMNVRAEIEGADEISELGESFNSMADELKLYTDDLEKVIDQRTDELQKANRRLEQLATTDQLTGLCNRRQFDEVARRALQVARRNKRPLSLVLVDTDRFKSINDRFGHPAGDQILKDVSNTLSENSREADLVARIGGEEFAVLMPEASIELAAQGAERMRTALEEADHSGVPELGDEMVTASFGVACLSEHNKRLEDLMHAADQAMYSSKSNGRNQVTLAPKPSSPPERRKADRRTKSRRANDTDEEYDDDGPYDEDSLGDDDAELDHG